MPDQISKEKIREIHQRLQRGSYQIIADTCDVSYGHVSDVLNCWSYSEDVILCAAALVKTQEQETTEKRAVIDEM